MMLVFIYGSLAALALWATCRDEYLRWIGFWLVGGFVLSNILFFSGVSASQRIGPYTAIEIMVAVSATWAAAARTRWLIAIIVFNLLSIAANIGLAANFPPTPRQIYLWELTTNMCFAAECLFAFGIGTAHGLRTGHFNSWVRLRRHPAQPDAARQGPEA